MCDILSKVLPFTKILIFLDICYLLTSVVFKFLLVLLFSQQWLFICWSHLHIKLYRSLITAYANVWYKVASFSLFQPIGLTPFTSYEYSLTACTAGGCTTTNAVSAMTDEAPPQGIVYRNYLIQTCKWQKCWYIKLNHLCFTCKFTFWLVNV